MLEIREILSMQPTTSPARGSAASWMNAGNPIEKNSRVNFCFSFGRLSPSLWASSSLTEPSTEGTAVSRSRLWVDKLLVCMPRPHIFVYDGRGGE